MHGATMKNIYVISFASLMVCGTTFRPTNNLWAFSQGLHERPMSDQKSEGLITTKHNYAIHPNIKWNPISLQRDTKTLTTQPHCLVATIICVASCEQLGTGRDMNVVRYMTAFQYVRLTTGAHSVAYGLFQISAGMR